MWRNLSTPRAEGWRALLVVLAVAIAALVAVGVIAGTRIGASPAQSVTVR